MIDFFFSYSPSIHCRSGYHVRLKQNYNIAILCPIVLFRTGKMPALAFTYWRRSPWVERRGWARAPPPWNVEYETFPLDSLMNYSKNKGSYNMVPQIFHKSRSHLQILGVPRVTRSPQFRSNLWISLLSGPFCLVHVNWYTFLFVFGGGGGPAIIMLTIFGATAKKVFLTGQPLLVTKYTITLFFALSPCATSRKVAGSIPDGVIGIFLWHNSSSRTMALGLLVP
jgi:hypothetical protein